MFSLQFLAPSNQAFLCLAYFTGLDFSYRKLQFITSNNFCFKIFGIFHKNEMCKIITILSFFQQESILSNIMMKQIQNIQIQILNVDCQNSKPILQLMTSYSRFLESHTIRIIPILHYLLYYWTIFGFIASEAHNFLHFF